jgi:hypothetical protein
VLEREWRHWLTVVTETQLYCHKDCVYNVHNDSECSNNVNGCCNSGSSDSYVSSGGVMLLNIAALEGLKQYSLQSLHVYSHSDFSETGNFMGLCAN